MNEQILELAIEARKYAETKPDIYQVAFDKKFAELIVRKCADIAFNEYAATNGAASGESAILKHFGVEE